MDPIDITTQEETQVHVNLQAAKEKSPKAPNPVPKWARLLFAQLVLVLPLLSYSVPDLHALPSVAGAPRLSGKPGRP